MQTRVVDSRASRDGLRQPGEDQRGGRARPAPTRTRRARCAGASPRSSTPTPGPTVRGGRSRVAGASGVAGRRAPPRRVRARQAEGRRRHAERRARIGASAPSASRPGHGGRLADPNAVPRRRGRRIRAGNRAEFAAARLRRAAGRARGCSVPGSAASRMDSGPARRDRLARHGASGSGRPATTIRSGRALLSGRPAGGEDAAVLRRALPHGGDQLHVLPDAERQDRRRLGWRQTPAGFRFTLKAPKRITHDRRLKDVGDLVRGVLRPRRRRSATALGALLFQLPPNLKCNLDVFDAFLDTLPPKVTGGLRVPQRVVARRRGLRAAARPQPRALHRRHRRQDDAARRDRRLRLLPAARRGLPAPPTSRAGPARSQAHASRWREAFVYFKHEDEGKGPEFGAGC